MPSPGTLNADSGTPVPRDRPLIELRGITKRFGSVVANAQVDLDVVGGEVHALLGENGAGKSTLVKILYGFYQADAGEISVNGKPTHIRTPADAQKLNIGMVFQNFTLVPALTVAENIALFLPDLGPVLDLREIAARIEETSRRYHLQVNPWTPVRQLSVGEQQKVEVLKLLLAGARFLILDEPTRVLVPHEIEGLFQIFEDLRRDGYAIVFITHKLPEVLGCAQQITVMRGGHVAGSIRREEATEDSLVRLMFGDTQLDEVRLGFPTASAGATPLLELGHAGTQAQGLSVSLKDISLRVMPGEIVGIAGVSGSGQKELGDLILGVQACAHGAKFLFGEDATRWPVARVRARGVAFVPEDPLTMAVVPWLTVQENMALGHTWKYARHGGLSVDWPAVQRDMERSFTELGLDVPPYSVPISALSGGNLQRAILARELAQHPKLILAFYPTRGLDVPSAIAVRRQLVNTRNSGGGVLLISEDLGELFEFSDRLLVLYQGRIVGQFRPEETSMAEVGRLMTGSEAENG
jgi:ABC-type uncharacterized transport system ATPase subunit